MPFSLTTFAERLKDARFKAGITQSHLGDAVGLSRVTIYNYEGAKQTPKINHIKKIAKALACDEGWLIGNTNDLDHNKELLRDLFIQEQKDNLEKYMTVNEFTVIGELPYIGARVSPDGDPVLDINKKDNIHLTFSKNWLKTLGRLEKFNLIEARGNSMEPTIYDTDLVLYDSSQQDIRPGKIYAVAYESHIYLKKLYLEPGKLILRSENKEYADIVIELLEENQPHPVKILGRVLWWSHTEKT